MTLDAPRSVAATVAATLCLSVLLVASRATAYPTYSTGGTKGYCADCHKGFQESGLHDGHKQKLSDDCAACHTGTPELGVILGTSDGGDGLVPIGCGGCHGRAEDHAPPASTYAAGLRQRHRAKGVTMCGVCHKDSDPAKFTPAAEAVLPPYYANPGNNHPNIPADACANGLDDDGDGDEDATDSDCGGGQGGSGGTGGGSAGSGGASTGGSGGATSSGGGAQGGGSVGGMGGSAEGGGGGGPTGGGPAAGEPEGCSCEAIGAQSSRQSLLALAALLVASGAGARRRGRPGCSQDRG